MNKKALSEPAILIMDEMGKPGALTRRPHLVHNENCCSHAELARKLTELEQRIEGHDTVIRSLFDAIRQLMAPPAPDQPPKEIGFHVKEDAVPYRTGRRKRSCH